MRNILDNFRFESDGNVTLTDALCRFIKDGIAFGRIKGGTKLPTIGEISKATGLSFYKARSVVEQLAREGYVHTRPHTGSVVLNRGGKVLRGHVLLVLPEEDICRYHPSQVMDILCRKMTEAGYAFSIATFSLDENDNLEFLKSGLLRATDLVIAARATPQVQKCLAESGVNHIFVYGNRPESDDWPWIRLSPETAISHFADHCVKAGVKSVVQVRFEDNETFNVEPALKKKGIGCSWMTISRGNGGRGRYNGIVQCSYKAFRSMSRRHIKEGLFLFWNSFITQGAVIAFLDHGIRLPQDVKVVTLSNTGVGPVYIKPFTRFEVDPISAGEKVADFALAVLAKGRIPRPPKITPQYVFGETFPF